MAIAPDILDRIARRLAGHAGLEPPAWIVEARASSRITALGCAPEAYAELIESTRDAGELAELVEAVRVGESRLFRHHTQIAALVDAVVPAWRARGRRSIRVWSAGCAAGEEPYTLAAVLSAAMPGTPISIVATDVSSDALELARSATYSADAIDDVPNTWRDGFTVEDGAVRVRADLAAMVRFERANLVDGPIGRGFDLVWCRNVLIYFTPEARKRVLDTLVGATAVGGYVFVGYSESLRDVAELEAMRAGDAVYYMKSEQPRTARTPPMGVPATKQHPPTDPGFPVPKSLTTRKTHTPTSPGFAVPPTVNGGASTASPMRASSRSTTGLGWPAVSAIRPANGELQPPTDSSGSPRAYARPPTDPGVLKLRGTPDVDDLTAELTTRLAAGTVDALTIDLDGAEMLGDELAPVLRRASAAARSAGVELIVRATRPGPKRWLVRHGLDDLGGET